MINFKVGILGAGRIAGVVADTLNKLDAFEPYSVAARDAQRAKSFCEDYNMTKFYGSYEELVNDPDVELIYIATPHSHHAEQAKLCINAGKPVLVEKSFSYNAATTEEVLKLSEDKGIFCGEAMWIRYLPVYVLLLDYIKKGAIGNVKCINCSLGYDLRTKERVVRPELAGGALLDVGVYPINLISMILGTDTPAVATSCTKLETGVDAISTINFTYANGCMAQAFSTMMYKADNNARIYGDKGYIELDNINNPEGFRVYHNDKTLMAEIAAPKSQISGYEFEFLAARDAIITGNVETPEMPHSETLRIMHFMDNLRRAWGYSLPQED